MKRFIISCLFILGIMFNLSAKQYVCTIRKKSIHTVAMLQQQMEKTIIDLIKQNYVIKQVIPSVEGGYTIGFTIIYVDNN